MDAIKKYDTVFRDIGYRSKEASQGLCYVDKLCEQYPDLYPREHRSHHLAKLTSPAFNEYLTKARGEYIQKTLAPRLAAAHFGHRIGTMALERLIEMLDDPDATIKPKDLVSLAQLGFGLAEKVDVDIKQTVGTGSVQVTNAMLTIIQGLPPELAEAFTLEYIRRQQQLVIDG